VVSLEHMEALVRWQRPADTTWTPVTDYSFEARDAVERPHADALVAGFGRDVVALDYGAGFGHLVRLLRERDVQAYAFEPYVDLADEAQPFKVDMLAGRAYSLVICREVLEHLTLLELRRTVTRICGLSARFVYITTRFAEDTDDLFAVDTADALDPTHMTMLHQDFLRALVVLEGFRRRADLERIVDWKRLGRCLVYERVAHG
jgi:hypothetical protein